MQMAQTVRVVQLSLSGAQAMRWLRLAQARGQVARQKPTHAAAVVATLAGAEPTPAEAHGQDRATPDRCGATQTAAPQYPAATAATPAAATPAQYLGPG